MSDWVKFFSATSPPAGYEKKANDIVEFCLRHANEKNKLAFVTSGGTRVPLELNAVRFLDNFSDGKRGSSSAEYFLDKGYAVIFLFRKGTQRPYLRFLSTDLIIKSLVLESDFKLVVTSSDISKAWQRYQEVIQSRSMLCIEFETLFEYLFLLKATGEALRPLANSAITYLAAAVSDFFIPQEKMAIHKIQSSDGPLTLQLDVVPKLLKPLVAEWAPSAFHISFKLETDESILLRKAKQALEQYRHPLVIANLLATYKICVILVDSLGQETILSLSEAEIKSDVDIESKIIDCIVEKHAEFLKAAPIV